MDITPEVRAFAIEQAGRRCECTGSNCRHHLRGARCKRGLRGDEWRVYWRNESGGATRENIEAWCLACFDNNFQPPREKVALLAAEIVGLGLLMEEDQRKAITLKTVLRDAAERAAKDSRGRVVLERQEDDLLMEFTTTQDAIDAARSLRLGFHDLASRLRLPTPELAGAILCGEVTRWRNGLLAGDVVDLVPRVCSVAGGGRIVLTDAAAEPLRGKVELEPVSEDEEGDIPPVEGLWTMPL